MLSASFGCVTYLRGIFPDDTFLEDRFQCSQDQTNSTKDGQRLMLIRRDCTPEATELLDYLVCQRDGALTQRKMVSTMRFSGNSCTPSYSVSPWTAQTTTMYMNATPSPSPTQMETYLPSWFWIASEACLLAHYH